MMSDQSFPNQHTTTVTTSSTTVQTNIRFEPSYVRTIPGILKVVQIILNLLGCICVNISYLSVHSSGAWFTTVSMGGFWFTGIMLVLYLFHIVEKFYGIPWLKIEFVFCAVWTFFYLIAACVVASWGSYDGGFAAGAFFGFCAMAAYGYDAFLKYVDFRAGKLAQGERVVNKQTTSGATSPAY